MIRKQHYPRLGWQQIVEAQGLVWHTPEGLPYWNEGVYYSFTSEDIEWIEHAAVSMYGLFEKAGDFLCARSNQHWLDRFGIPAFAHKLIRQTWEQEPPCLNYGRFDFGYDGINAPKLFEFNADTPTSLLEASVIQWLWKEDLFPHLGQFNEIHECLVDKWRDIRPYLEAKGNLLFTHAMDDIGEDTVTVGYLRDTAEEAGLTAKTSLINFIGTDRLGRFVDHEDYVIGSAFKLYPWEWLVNESYAPNLETSAINWIEPIWKMMWSNKAILPLLYQLDPENPYLLGASYEKPPCTRYVQKPILAREGANIAIIDEDTKRGVVASTGGQYGEEGYIYQETYDLPEMADGVYPVLGVWMVDGYPAGMGIREDGLITGNGARFTPHVIED